MTTMIGEYGIRGLLTALIFGAYALPVQSALIDRGGGFIYDDVLNITWTQNANINGLMDHPEALSWSSSLSVVDTRPGAGGFVYDDWRLPSMDVDGINGVIDCSTASEADCRDNEYGYLYHQYGITPSSPDLFTNMETEGPFGGGRILPVGYGGSFLLLVVLFV